MIFTLGLNIVFKNPSVKRIFKIPQNIPQKPEDIAGIEKKMNIN